jgi:glutamate decarboxylase/cystathionine beta-synthase
LQEPAVIVTVLCDLGVKYLTKVYNEDWLHENHVEISSPDSA